MSQASIDRVLSCPNLPTLPAVAMRVLELAAIPEVSLSQIAAVIENDPAIASKVLRTINSSFYSLSRRCGSIQQALAFLGLQSVKALVLGFSLSRSINGGGDDEVSFDFLDYWRRSLFSAAAAREIALITRRCDPDEAFVTALVQDLGTVALWRAFGDRYLQALDLTKGDHRKLCAIEQRSLETDHTIISAEMVSRWRFPDSIVTAVRCHHRSHDADSTALQLARTVELAGTAASVLAARDPETELVRLRRDGQEWFEIRPAPMTLLLKKIADQAAELSRAFGLEAGASVDVDAILATASRIRREQKLVEPVPDADHCDLIDHASLSFAAIPDARAFGSDLEQTFTDNTRRSGIGILLIGVDRAKLIQESFGTRGLEDAMTHALNIGRAVAGKTTRLYRFVGAELAVLVPDTDIEDLCRVGELIRRGCAENRVGSESSSSKGFPVTVSIGAAIYESLAELRAGTCIETPDQLVRAAMFALAAGRRERNRVVVFHNDLKVEQEAG